MPRGKIPSWAMKTAIWDLVSKLGPKPEAILRDLEKLCHRDMPLEGEAPPDSRTVKSVIQELQTLKLEVLATLPRRIWQLRGDYHTIRAELENLVAGGTLEDLPSVAGKLKIQLRAPAPETVLIDDFGGPGKHRIHLKQDTIKVIQENLGYGISMFKAIRGSSSAGSGEINLEVSTYGDLKLRCLVKGKDYSLSKKLISSLSETAQQKFDIWKKRGGQYLGKCSEIYREIHTEASYKTGQSIYEFGSRVFSKLGPPPLTSLFGDLVYQLCILYRRSRGQYGLPDRRLYQIKRHGLLFSVLYLGQLHLANAPLSPPPPPPLPPPPSFLPPLPPPPPPPLPPPPSFLPPLPPPPPNFLETWIDLHRNMIVKWSASPAITELLMLYQELRGIEATIKQELDDIIRGKQL